jgi:hypothetical protein
MLDPDYACERARVASEREEGFMNVLRALITTVPITLFLLGGLSAGAAAREWRVPQEVPTIQEAVNAAQDGDVVRVAPGVYAESILWQGKQLALVGAGAWATVVDPSAGPGGRCLTMEQVPSPSRVQGITCRNGSAETEGPGGGVSVDEASVTVEGCAFLGNEALIDHLGGGLYLSRSSHADVSYSVFAGNSADLGGGMAAYDDSSAVVRGALFEDNMGGLYVGDLASVDVAQTAFLHNHTRGGLYAPFFGIVRVSDSVFEGNASEGFGGGMYGRLGSAEVIRCVFRDNAASRGGGLALSENESSVTDSWFLGNEAVAGDGGGLRISIGGTLIERCHFIDNEAATNGGGVSVQSDSHTDVKSAVFRGNRAGTDGGGMSVRSVFGVSWESCAFSDNTAVGRGGGVNIRGFEEVARMSSSLVVGNVAGDRGGGMAIALVGGELSILNTIINLNQPDQVWLEDDVALALDRLEPGQ